MAQIPVLYLCVGMNDLGGTSNHLRNILKAAPAAGIDPVLWIATKIPETLETYFEGVPAEISFHTRYKAYGYLPLIWRLAKELRTRRIQVIHSFQLQSDIVAIVAGLLARVHARVSSFEGRLVYGSTRVRRWTLGALNRIVRPWFSANVFISEHLLRTYGDSYRIPVKKRYLNYLGLPESWFQNPPPPRLDPAPFMIGFVGRIDAEKGYELFIEAVKLLTEQGWSATFRIVGGGQCEGDARDRIRCAGLEEKIDMRGWQADIRTELECLDIVVLPSHEEGLSFVAIESLSRKRVVVASRVGGLPEVIEDGQTGYLVEPENAKMLVLTIQRAADDWKESQRRAEQGYQRASEQFSVQREVKGFAILYRSLIGPVPAHI